MGGEEDGNEKIIKNRHNWVAPLSIHGAYTGLSKVMHHLFYLVRTLIVLYLESTNVIIFKYLVSSSNWENSSPQILILFNTKKVNMHQ